MAALYIVDQSVVRFWDTHNPKDAVRREGDIQVVCTDCLERKLELVVSHPGVHHLHHHELGGDVYNVCKFCGDIDPVIAQKLHAQFVW